MVTSNLVTVDKSTFVEVRQVSEIICDYKPNQISFKVYKQYWLNRKDHLFVFVRKLSITFVANDGASIHWHNDEGDILVERKYRNEHSWFVNRRRWKVRAFYITLLLNESITWWTTSPNFILTYDFLQFESL